MKNITINLNDIQSISLIDNGVELDYETTLFRFVKSKGRLYVMIIQDGMGSDVNYSDTDIVEMKIEMK